MYFMKQILIKGTACTSCMLNADVVILTVPFLLLLQLAIDYGIKFLETSAKSSTNVEEVWENCLMLI